MNSVASHDVRTTDFHAAGEPFRIACHGVPEIPGDTVLDRREAARREPIDALRRLLCHEPRGHAGMYGCFLVPPNDPGAHLGVLFWHKDGYSTACGHGTLALGAWAVHSGRVAASPEGETPVVIDVPSGRVTARVLCHKGAVGSVVFRNVPSYVVARDVAVTTSFGTARVDVAYGGALYASVAADALGLAATGDQLGALVQAGREVKRAVEDMGVTTDAAEPRLSGLYGTILYDSLPDTISGPHQRNVTIFADGQVDRSPCGSGTSARLALLAADGLVGEGLANGGTADARSLTHDSIIGTRFLGRVVAKAEAAGGQSIITEIEGSAFRTGEHRFLLDLQDRLGTGFVLY